ncbi:flagellar basal-body MS-ring/collar protein FliF [Cellulosilyticum sp. ST5]|uniref:flagellar basal-body MS-ring/collar protein FliF n=1 Tax=Cellulosilyticum sp. ST5 TaxID=3055805 RepID=UPI003977641A
MQQTIEQISNQITEKLNNLTKKQKIQIGIGVLALIIAITAVVLLTRPKMKNLFSENLDSKSIGQVATVLNENGIKYKLINDSTNIQVQENQYEQALMYTAMSDVPESGMTFEQVINNTMSTTQTEMTAKNNEYKKQQLERTLRSMEGIENARVELVIPEQKNAYLQSQVESRASIFLTLSKTLTTKQCEGIATYISSSVANLDKKNIVVIDSQGNTLYSGSEESQLGLNKQQEIKLLAEQDVTQKVSNLLGNMYDDVRVSPNLILDFDQYQESSQKYQTQGEDESRGVIQQETQASSSTKNNQTGAEPGTTTNGGDIPTYQTNNGTSGESKETQKDITYAPDKTESVYVKNPGNVDLEKSSLSVNLFKNKIYREEEVKPTLTGMTWSEFKVSNREQRTLAVDESIVNSVKSATGIDNVVVNAYENPIFLDQEVYQIDYKDYLPLVFLVLALLLIAFVVLRFRKHEEIVEVEPELEVEEMLKAAKEQVELEEIELKETLETKRQIDKFVDEKPEAVANLLRNWLTEEDWE